MRRNTWEAQSGHIVIEVKLLRKPQCTEELEPPEAAKEKQVSTLRCELSLKTLQIGICASRTMRSSIDVVLSDQVCYNSKQKIQHYSLSSSLHRISWSFLWSLLDEEKKLMEIQHNRCSRYIVFIDTDFHLTY